MEELKRFLNGRVVLKVGDITKEDAHAIVNAANGSLMGGGGVDGAIHRAGGPEILKQCKEIRKSSYPDGLPTGQAAVTTAGNMAAKNVIHTVGPVYGRGGKQNITSCTGIQKRTKVKRRIHNRTCKNRKHYRKTLLFSSRHGVGF